MYIVEYILNTPLEWSAWFTFGKGTKTQPMTVEGLLYMYDRHRYGELIILRLEVLK